MWIVKKCETGHRQCVSVRQSVRQSVHPIRYIFHAVSQATGSLSPLPLASSLSLSWSVNHCIWLGYWHPFLILLADNKEPNTKLSFLSLLLLGSLLCPDNKNNNNLSTITTTATTTVAIIADNQSLHVFHFVFLHSFFGFFFDNAATGLNKSVSLSPDVIKY